MILKKVYLYLDTIEFEREYGSKFLFETSFVCYYVNRQLAKLKFKTKKISKIAICLTKKRVNIEDEIDNGFLKINLVFEKALYDGLSAEKDKANFFIKKIKEGLNSVNIVDIPIDDIEGFLSEFVKNNYCNEWVHKTKRKKDILASLECKIDIKQFYLFLKIYKRDKLILNKCILTTLPDELIYLHRFKDIVIKQNEVIVKNKFGDVVEVIQLDG